MEHLYASVVKVQRLQVFVEAGRTPRHEWVDQAPPLDRVRCRLDLNFIRPGKDVLPPLEAGVARDRVGIMFCSAAIDLRAGDRIVAVSGPEYGTFEIRNIPDRAQDFSTAHHIEVQIVETNQTLSGPTTFPSEDSPPEATPPLEP